MNLGDKIKSLRKEKNVSQEKLAQYLKVSFQAVSKWENGQCCPDIQLLPELAKVFQVSIDELMGYQPEVTSEDMVQQLRRQLEELPEGEDFKQVFRLAAVLHSAIFSKRLTAEPNGNPGWNTEDAIEHAANSEWGYSALAVPEITTVMRRGTVLFSSNTNLGLQNRELQRIAALIKPFGKLKNLKVAVNLYQLTLSSEESYATAQEVAEHCGISEAEAEECLQSQLSPYLQERERDGRREYRFEGMYLSVIPMLSLFDMR